MKTDNESVLTLRDTQGKLIAFFCHDMQDRHITMYTCEKADIEQIKSLITKIQDTPVVGDKK